MALGAGPRARSSGLIGRHTKGEGQMSEAPRFFGPRAVGKKAAHKGTLKPTVVPVEENSVVAPGSDYDVAELNAQHVGQILKRVLARRKRNGKK